MRRVFLILLLIPTLLSALYLPENDQVLGEAERGHGKQKAGNSMSDSFKAEMNNNIGNKIVNNNGEATSAMHTDDNGTERGRRVEGNPGMADSFRVNTQANRVPAADLDNANSTTSAAGMFHGSERFTYEMQELSRQKRATDYMGCQPSCICNVWEGKRNGKVNIMRGRPARGAILMRIWSHEPCVAANGYEEIEENGCFHTIEGAFQLNFWEIDMQAVYTIRTLEMFSRPASDLLHDKYRLQNKRFSVNGQTCFLIRDDSKAARQLYENRIIICNRPVRGQYFIMENARTIKDVLNSYVIVCEFKVWVCEGDNYFDQKTKTCRKCGACPHLCDNYYGCTKNMIYNVATRRPIVSSRTSYGLASEAVDGRTTWNRYASSCFEILNKGVYSSSYSQYCKVDLIFTFMIESILIQPRYDCCAERMKGMYILLFNATKGHTVNLNTYRSYEQKEICKRIPPSFSFTTGFEVTSQCNPPTLASIVALQAIYPTQLNVCELQVNGYAYTVIQPGESGCNKTYVTTCKKGCTCEHNICRAQLFEPCEKKGQYCLLHLQCDSRFLCKKKINASCTENECSDDMVCDSGICKIGLGSKCNSTSDCAQGLVCDLQNVCRKGQDVVCSKTEECIFGAKCSQRSPGIFKCNCTRGLSSSGLCGSSCNPAVPNSCTHGSCNAALQLCECQAEYVMNAAYKCILRFGADCIATDDCVQQTCENKKCKIYVRGACLNDSLCETGAVCENQICQYQPGHACNASDTGVCISGTICQSGECRLKLGENCSNFEPYCAEPLLCESTVNGKTCRLQAGHLCLGSNSTMCLTSSVCDDHICRIKYGETCNSDTQKYCYFGSFCDSSKCRLGFSFNCTGNENKCAIGYTCDALKTCRIPKNGDCKEDTLQCLAGGYCNSDFTCECSEVNADRDAELCDPVPGVVGSPCSRGDKDCTMEDTHCDMQNTPRCICSTGLTTVRTNYTCRGIPGSSCNISVFCASGMVCGALKICNILPGELCQGYESLCSAGTVCDVDGYCRYRFDRNCTLVPKFCAVGYICDFNKLCRIPVGEMCTSDDECEAGSSCVESVCSCMKGSTTLTDGKCVPDKGTLGGSCLDGDPKCIIDIVICKDSICSCPPRYVRTSDLFCRKNYGMPCVQDDECAQNMICNNKFCRVSLGHICSGLDEECVTGAVCDIDGVCKLDMNSNCSNNANNCKAGTYCDWYTKCRLGVNSGCKNISVCPTGAICKNGYCFCEENKAEAKGIICAPVIGRVGSFCNEVTKPCVAPGSTCITEKCECPDGHKTQDFSCEMIVVEKPEKDNTLLLLLLILGGALLLTTLICCCLWFCRKKKEKEDEMQKERKKSRIQLKALEMAVMKNENLEAPPPERPAAPPPERPAAPPPEEPEAPPPEEPEAPPPEEPEAPPLEEPEAPPPEEHETPEKDHDDNGEEEVGEHEEV